MAVNAVAGDRPMIVASVFHADTPTTGCKEPTP